jgi:ribosomal protein L11 methyltransferase
LSRGTSYTETKVYTTTAGVEPVAALLARYGIEEVSVEDAADLAAIIEAKDKLGWDYIDEGLTGAVRASSDGGPDGGSDGESGSGFDGEAVVTFYTVEGDEGAVLLTEIKAALMMLKADEQYGEYGADADFGRLYAESEPLSDEWKERYKERFRAFRVSERIVVRPAWDGSDDFAENDIVIRLDPGMAFGTGEHETTAACLAELERAVRPGARVLDVGTGSGILAIAAVKLGAGGVTAVEYDDDAAAAASENFARNGVADRVELVCGDIMESAGSIGAHDVVVANLTSGLVSRIAGALPSLTRRGGRLIVSGLLERDEPAMREALAGAGFEVVFVERRGEWLTLRADFS